MLTAFQLATLAAMRGQTPEDDTVNKWIANANAPQPQPAPVVAQPPPVVSNPDVAQMIAKASVAPAVQPVQGGTMFGGVPGVPIVPVTYKQADRGAAAVARHTTPATTTSAPSGAASGPVLPASSGSQSKDASVGLSVAPLEYGVVNTPGSPGGEVDMVGPKAHRIEIGATNLRSDAALDLAHANAVAAANEAALYPERAKYYADLAEKEARDQGGRDEQNRQRLEDIDRETKELRDIKVDPDRYKANAGNAVAGFMAAVLGGALAPGNGGRNVGLEDFRAKERQDINLQQDEIQQKRGYIDQVRQAIRDQREMQGDQVASGQRRTQLANASFESQVRQAMLEGQVGKDIATGNANSADVKAARMDQNAARIRNVQPTGGGQKYVVKDPATGATMVMDAKEFNAHVKDVSKDIRTTGLGITRDGAKADSESKGKKEEDMSKRLVPRADGSSYYAATAEEAKAHREADLAAAQLKGAVQEMKALRNKLGAADVSGYNTEDARTIKSLQAQASVSFGKMKGLGTYDSGMERLAEQIFGDPTGLRSPVTNYDALIGRIDADAAARARSAEGPLRPNMPASFKVVK